MNIGIGKNLARLHRRRRVRYGVMNVKQIKACVLDHVARTRPPAAVVITDGYIEQLSSELVQSIGSTRLHAIVTRDGSSQLLEQAQIPFTQLGRIPQ